MDTNDAIARLFLLQREDHAVRGLRNPRVIRSRDVFWDLGEILGGYEILNGLGWFFLVKRVVEDQLVEGVKILPQILFPLSGNAMAVNWHRHAQEDQHDTDHDHHLDERESPSAGCVAAFHFN